MVTPARSAQQGRRELPADQPLESNQDNFTHYYSRRTRAQGEVDARELAAHAGSKTKEEVWLYFEGTSQYGTPLSYWYEIGMGETDDHAQLTHSSDLLFAIMADFKTVRAFSEYHFHPRFVGKKARYLGDEYPSPIDISSYLVSGAVALMVGAPAVKVDFRVVTKTGVYVVTPNYDELRHSIPVAQSVLDSYSSEFYRQRMLLGDQVEENHAFAARTSTPKLRIEFRAAGELDPAVKPAKKKQK